MIKSGYELDGSFCSFFGAYAKIYTLSDETGNIFYVGCTTSPIELRFSGHLSEARYDRKYTNRRKNEHIRSLNYKVIITVVDMIWVTASRANLAHQKAHNLEKEWTLKFLSLGYKLLNGRLEKIKLPKMVKSEFIGQSLIANPKDDSSVEILEMKNHKSKTGTLK